MSPAFKMVSPSLAAEERIGLGAETLDRALGGGLTRAGLHEVYAATQADSTAAAGFSLGLAARAAAQRPVLLVWQDIIEIETGRLDPHGLCGMGLDPSRFVLVRAQNIKAVLSAGEQAARCPALGAVVIALWGASKLINLTTSRRLSLASSQSGLPVFVMRCAVEPCPSVAATRWLVRAQPSRRLAANAPGFPAVEANLLRHRGGTSGGCWCVEWDHERKSFKEQSNRNAAPQSRGVVSLSVDGPPAHPERALRKAG